MLITIKVHMEKRMDATIATERLRDEKIKVSDDGLLCGPREVWMQAEAKTAKEAEALFAKVIKAVS